MSNHQRSLTPLFSPRSLAIVGASENPRKWGNWLARGALIGEGRRSVHFVNRRGGEILGRPAYTAIGDLPEPPELVAIALPDAALEEAVGDALAAGARAIIAVSAADNDDARVAERDAALAAAVRAAGAVLLGPNCLGVLDLAEELQLTTNPLPPGPIGLVSQSGNLALELGLIAGAEGLGISRFASLGNQADLDCTALVRDLTLHDGTALIALYVEDFHDGRAFARAAAEAVDAGKPVVAIAVQTGDATSRAARSHTGALASDGAAIDAAFAAAGVHRVRTPRELVDVAQALLRARRAGGRRVAILSDGGGHGTIAAALSVDAGLSVPELCPATVATLRSLLPPRAATANPVDLAGAAESDVHAFDLAADALLGGEDVDAVLMTGYFGGYWEYGEEYVAEEVETARCLGAVATRTGRPIVAHTMFPGSAAADAMREAGIPVYGSVDQAVRALTCLAQGCVPGRSDIPALPAPASTGHAGRGRDSDGGYQAARSLLADAVTFAAQRTVTDGVELLIRARWDERFGPVVFAGSGGVHAEVMGDTATALAPVTETQAETMLRSLRCAPRLLGARGRAALDIGAAAGVLVALSALAAAHPEIAEMEVNPLLVTRHGAIGLDARIVRAHT